MPYCMFFMFFLRCRTSHFSLKCALPTKNKQKRSLCFQIHFFVFCEGRANQRAQIIKCAASQPMKCYVCKSLTCPWRMASLGVSRFYFLLRWFSRCCKEFSSSLFRIALLVCQRLRHFNMRPWLQREHFTKCVRKFVRVCEKL